MREIKTSSFRTVSKSFAVAIVISMIFAFFAVFPLLLKPTSLYFSMDPDPIYVGNALRVLQTGRAIFFDHPGTPLISLIALFLVPIKFYVNNFLYISDFNIYFLQHLDFIYLYTRVLLLITLFVGLSVFHFVIYKRYSNVFVNILFGLLLFLDPMHTGMYWGITPEILAFTLTAFWFYFLHKFEKTGLRKFIFFASFFSGIIIATKMSFLFVFLANFLFLILRFGKTLKIFLKNWNQVFFKAFLLSGTGFVFGIIPILYEIKIVAIYLLNFLVRTGKMGGGGLGLVDPKIFLTSLSSWFAQPLILISFLIFLFFVTKTLKGEALIKSILISSVIGIFAFMRYADFHYQTANILLFVIAISALFIKLSRLYKTLILIIVLVLFNISSSQYFQNRRQLVVETYNLQKYIDSKNFHGKIIWEYGLSRDFSVLRSFVWSHAFSLEELLKVYPSLMQLNTFDGSRITDFSGKESYFLDKYCWQVLMLQETSWNKFINMQKNQRMYIKENIPGTQMLSITYKDNLNCKSTGAN